MATTVTSTKTVSKKEIGLGGPRVPGPNGKNGNGWRGRDDEGARRGFSPETYRVTMWVMLAAIVMMFVALSSAYIILSAGDQWRPVRMPRMFFLSTGIILVSSATIRTARRSLKQASEREYTRWLLVTLLLGLSFLVSQFLGWRQLVTQGVYFSGHPHSSFFYLFSGAHGVHVLGGLLALSYLFARALRGWKETAGEKREALTDVVSLYWHFMDGIWIWLFLLLLLWG